MTRTAILATIAAATLAAPALAQAAPQEGKSPASGQSVTLDQVSSPNAARIDTAPAPERTPADLDMAQPAPPPRAAAVTSGAIPTTREARALATAPVVGDDRCDPAAGKQQLELCRQRLEARAGEYNRPHAAPVTPEGRLLLLTTPTPPATDAAGRPLGPMTGLNGPNSPAEQLAGALQSQAAGQDGANPANPAPGANPLPSGVPPIVVLPGK